ncbi:MAG: hypothetical protein ABI904_12080 [Chloroflexota bacterium]
MNLIDKYVAEVGRHLPLLKGREDIEKELKSTLEDMLDERRQAGVSEEAQVIQLLQEYGSPQKVASTYNPHPYLIGPKLFPFFLMVLKIVVTVVVAVLLVLAGIRAATATPLMGAEFVSIVGRGLADALSAAIAACGNVVLIFAILERVLPEKEIGGFNDEKDWDPASLAHEPDPDSIKRFELITEIVFTFVALTILNLYPQWLGMFFFSNGEQTFIPLFTDAFFRFVPWINIVLVAEILLDIYLLREAVWRMWTRIAKIVIEAASLAITIILFRTPSIFGFNAETIAQGPFSPEQAQIFIKIATFTLPIVLVVILIIQGIELAKAVYGLLRVNYRIK